MTESRQDNKTLPFVGGLLIGAVAAALFSPRNGVEMRKDVKDKAMDIKDKFENKKQDLKKKTDEAADKAENKFEEGKSQLEDKARRAKDNNRSVNQ